MKTSSVFKAVTLFVAMLFISNSIFAASPPGLSKANKSPSGLQNKTPAGWSKGKKKGWYKPHHQKAKIPMPSVKTKLN